MLRRFVSSVLAFPEWLYGRRAAGLDLAPAIIAGGWAILMIVHPRLFDQGSFVGMSWMADEAWIVLMTVLACLHVVGLAMPWLRAVRVAAALLSAWAWTFVAVSFARVEIGTGVLAYGLFGMGALFSSIFIAGQPRERG